LAGEQPEIYCLRDLLDDKVHGTYYKEQLHKTDPPAETAFFKVEKVLHSRRRGGKKQYYVKYLHYPNKFNSWIEEENLVDKSLKT
jgi:hypothetical protein